MEIKKPQYEDEPILTVIQQVKDGRVEPSTLTKEIRTRCVEVLWLEGYKVSEVAQILKRSEKTIKRDLNEIRDQNAISPDVDIAKKIIGEFLLKANNSYTHLIKLARSKEGSLGERAQTEYYAHMINSDTISKLQSLGYLPSATKTFAGSIFHHYGGDNDIIELETMKNEILEMKKLSPSTNKLSDIEQIIESMPLEAKEDKFNE